MAASGGRLKRPGDTVAAGEPLVEVDTEKLSVELPAPAAGTLLEITVAEGGTAPIGTVVALIGDANRDE